MRRRRNFLPTFILGIFFWLAWLLILFFIPPESSWSMAGFFLTLFLSLFLTLSLFLANSRRGFWLSLALALLLILRWQEMLNALNFILLAAAVVVLEMYFTKLK